MGDLHALSVGVRWAHVAAMAVVLGGAVLIFTLAFFSGERNETAGEGLVLAAVSYEWTFWAAVGVLVMTGIGNLAALGAALSPPETTWGTTLVAKLSTVLMLAILSVPRTLAVASFRVQARPAAAPGVRMAVRILYGATACTLAAILALAVSLAH